MITLENIKRVCDWNAARYPQEVSPALQRALLLEEIDETIVAIEAYDDSVASLVEILDGCGDITFVAIGGLWKHGLTPERIYTLVNHVGFASLPSIRWANRREELLTYLKARRSTYASLPYDMVFNLLVLHVVSHAMPIGTAYAVDEVLGIVCTSNETKTVKRTASDVKANVDKGQGFVPPTEALTDWTTYAMRMLYDVEELLSI